MIVACVCTGTKYAPKYVYRLRNMVAANLDVPYEFVCLTDKPDTFPDIQTFAVDPILSGWWAKLELFKTKWRAGHRVLYFDLDSVIVGDLTPLANLDVPFGICANFTQLYEKRVCITGKLPVTNTTATWPCRYGSCCMTIDDGWGGHIWETFNARRSDFMCRNRRLGDQKVIEEIEPDVPFLQPLLPDGFFLGYRDLPDHPFGPPDGASVIVFAGRHKPDNTDCFWVRDAWK